MQALFPAKDDYEELNSILIFQTMFECKHLYVCLFYKGGSMNHAAHLHTIYESDASGSSDF